MHINVTALNKEIFMDENSDFDIKTIIWAVDVFTDIPEVERKAAQNIFKFLKAMKIQPKIIPVNVSPEVIKKEHFPLVEKEINKRLAKIKLLKLEPTKIIPEKTIYPQSPNDKALTLINYAKKIKCDLIVITTHAKLSTSHYIIGSFTNELISHSPISLLIFNPLCGVKPELSKILLPLANANLKKSDCDFIVQFTKQLGAKLTIFLHGHTLSTSYFSKGTIIGKLFRKYEQQMENKIKILQNNVRQKLHTEIPNLNFANEIDVFSLKESISLYVKNNNISLILLVHMEQNSVIKYVMRKANCLVLVLR
jgi:nucleotide-binding universal stress UspA family protein